MPDPIVPTDFERHLTDALASHAAVATDPRPTRVVAAEAMRLGRRRTWAWPWPRQRLLGLAALLLLPLAIALGAAALLRSEAAKGAVAVVARSVGSSLDVVLVDPEGRERVLRHLTGERLGLGPDRVFEGASLGPNGWLVLYVDSSLVKDYRTSLTVFVDLADPDREPIVLPSNGFIGPRWGPDGEAALVCGPAPDCGRVPDPDGGPSNVTRVLDLEAGTETIVPGVQLHGGTPEPIWTADGSGFLHRFQTLGWGVTPLEVGPVVRGTPAILSRRFRLEPPSAGATADLIEPDTVGRAWLGDRLAPAIPVTGVNASDGEAIWMLLDGWAGTTRQAIVAKLTGPGEIASVHRFDVPEAVTHFELSPDDTWVALDLRLDDPWPFVFAAVDDDAPTSETSPVIDGLLLGLVPAAEADAWPTD